MMNLSKTEKLLAARKKLKEFQLSKKGQGQDNIVKQQNDLPMLQQADVQKEESEKQWNVPINDSEKVVHNIIPNVDSNDHKYDGTQNYNFNIPVEINSMPEEPTVNNDQRTNNQLTMKEVTHVLETNSNEQDNSSVYRKEITELHPSPDLKLKENGGITYSNNVLPNETSIVQKEHLLQMASAVAEALTDGAEYTETTSITEDLECRNQFLSSCLEEQKQIVNQLHIQLSQCNTRLSELEAILSTKDAEFEARLVRELNPLKEQLQVHTQTTGILIAEKAELTAALSQTEITAKQKAEENEELSANLKYSQLRVTELEKELALIKNNNEDVRKVSQKMQYDYEDLSQRYTESRKEKEDLELELSELKQKLNLKNTEMIGLQQELQEKTALLSLNELRIQQLTNTSQELQTLEDQHQSVSVLEQQLTQMRETLKSLNDEKEEASKQYQNYVRQLDMQQAKLQQELENGRKQITDLETREKSYIQRLSELEQQLQKEREKVDTLTPLQNNKEYVDNLTKNIDELTLEQERLHIALSEKDTDIEVLKKEIQDLRDMNEQNVEASKLAKALESEQLGASRAVSQNQQLKQQLNEMHDAFVLLSNTKLDLTEQLQAERTIGRKLNIQLNKVEAEVEQLKEQLKEKEASLKELEKQKLHEAQIADQMQHYQAQSQQAQTLQQELQRALVYIETLKKENQQLTEKLNAKVENEIRQTEKFVIASSQGTTIVQQTNDNKNIDEADEGSSSIEKHAVALQTEEIACPNFSESFKKLEERFKETMEKVAELTDEKQRLEHLVLQLQGETETIGEYITLYQKQRAILQEKAKEKEQTFQQIVEQRNQQQEQLHKLKVLVADLLKKIPNNTEETDSPITLNHKDGSGEQSTEHQVNENKAAVNVTDETTSQILDLLTEIKDCKDTCTLEPNFHPCPWCYGKLIIV